MCNLTYFIMRDMCTMCDKRDKCDFCHTYHIFLACHIYILNRNMCDKGKAPALLYRSQGDGIRLDFCLLTAAGAVADGC